MSGCRAKTRLPVKISGRKALAAMSPAGSQHLATTNGGHAGAEAVTALANELAGLIGSLHGTSPVLSVANEIRHRDRFRELTIARLVKEMALTEGRHQR
jgi:hypothetical protein